MRRFIAFILVSVMLASLASVAFAAPACPVYGCTGFIRTYYTPWVTKTGYQTITSEYQWEERTGTKKCDHCGFFVSSWTETRNGHTVHFPIVPIFSPIH